MWRIGSIERLLRVCGPVILQRTKDRGGGRCAERLNRICITEAERGKPRREE